METKYDFRKGLSKGIKFILTALIALATVSGFSEVSLWELLEQYLKPVVSALTVGGILTWLLNYTKVKLGGVKNSGKKA